ncbi:endostatin-like outer membrane lipoprotein LenA [Leptospira ainlahdjerensis]|uniref:endostatin-like outer membrane lipoprotein LenA n=1 Tax=Leptospira ainlahdjerensis TaxID=2810033 RepID=UPI001E57D6F0|nr:hypothetical protein [Leptospira ainlahdjerensis]
MREESGTKVHSSLIQILSSRFFLFLLLFFVAFSLFSEGKEADDHKTNSSATATILNRRILRIYEDLGVARELIKLERIDSVPNGTYISFLGNFPNRKGIKVTKHSISEGKSGIERAESKSILLEFTGTTLSRVITEVRAENADGSDVTVIRLVDETPLDQNLDDILVETNRNGKEMRYPIQFLPDEGNNRERSAFKQEFYVKLLEDFLVQVLRLHEMQNQESAKNKKKLLQTFKDSLQY